jgi:CubicO group peptidase (beta-lactamase class C family)
MSSTLKRALAHIIILAALVFGYFQFIATDDNNKAKPLSVSEIDTLVANAQKAFNIPGIAVGIVKDGKITFAKGYGVRTVGKPQPVTPDTLYGIASHTKAFTTAALAILVDEGRITWDDKVKTWLPEFELYNDYVTTEFTIRDLLTHRSGLPLGAGDLMWWPNPNFTRLDVIRGLKHLKPSSAFRTKYDYDNLLYIAAGEIVSRVSGVQWEDYVTDKFLNPLGMGANGAGCVTMRNRLAKDVNEATPHMVVNGTVETTFFMNSEPSTSAASIQCSITGLSKWVVLHLNEGKMADGTALFSEVQHKEMWTPQTLKRVSGFWSDNFSTKFSTYGLGWNITDVHGERMIQHSGGLQGMVTLTTMLPEQELGIVVLTNTMNGAAMRAISFQIMEGYLPVKGKPDWVQYYAGLTGSGAADDAANIKAMYDARDLDNKPSLPIGDFAGTYTDAWYGDVTIEYIGGMMRVNFTKTPVLKGVVEHFEGNVFVVKWDDRALFADAFMAFEVDDDGKIIGLKMRAISALTDFSFDFHDLDLKPTF